MSDNCCIAYMSISLKYIKLLGIAFTALILLVGRQEEHLAYISWVMRCWCGYLCGLWSEVQIVCIWSSRCHCLARIMSDYSADILLLFTCAVCSSWFWITFIFILLYQSCGVLIIVQETLCRCLALTWIQSIYLCVTMPLGQLERLPSKQVVWLCCAKFL